MGAIVKRWAATMARRQDFGIGAHGTSQEFSGQFAGERSALPGMRPGVQAIGSVIRMRFCDYTDL
jgi:hypothetical protein